MRRCEYKQAGERWQCVFCGLEKPEGPPRARRCGTPGLGDLVATALSAVGITKELASKTIGKPCGCEARQRWLNEWGTRVQMRARRLAQRYAKAVFG